jgi:hypothetical protein
MLVRALRCEQERRPGHKPTSAGLSPFSKPGRNNATGRLAIVSRHWHDRRVAERKAAWVTPRLYFDLFFHRSHGFSSTQRQPVRHSYHHLPSLLRCVNSGRAMKLVSQLAHIDLDRSGFQAFVQGRIHTPTCDVTRVTALYSMVCRVTSFKKPAMSGVSEMT